MSDNKVKILHIANMNTDSGVACFLMNYMREMDFSHFEMDFVCWDKREDNFYDEIKKLGGRIYTVTSYKKNPMSFLGGTRAIVRRGGYDIVHGHEAIMSIPAFWFAKRTGVKVRIAHSHSTNMKTKVKDLIVKCCHPLFRQLCTSYLACSCKAGEYLFGSIFKENGKIMNDAIDLAKFKFSPETRIQMRESLGIKDEFVLGHVGRFNEYKNHEFLIDIFMETNERRPDSKLLLIGDGEKQEHTRSKVKSKGLDNNVVFLGIQKNVNEWMQAMDVFVFPSLFEGLGIVLIEAQASGIMCYCSSEVPKEADCGRLTYIPLTDNQSIWAERCLSGEMLNRDEAYKRVGEAGYDIIAEAQKLQKYYVDQIK